MREGWVKSLPLPFISTFQLPLLHPGELSMSVHSYIITVVTDLLIWSFRWVEILYDMAHSFQGQALP